MIKTKLKNRNLSQEDVFNFSELFKLMKPRVMSLVIFTCAVGLLMAPNVISTKDAIIGIILVSIGAGAAGALNMWYESDLDALMTRTCLRPIPTGKVNKNQALVFGVALSIFSVIGLVVFFANLIWAFSKKKAAAQNPWGEGATTLEWTVPSPPNFHTFEELPKFEDEEGVEKSTS